MDVFDRMLELAREGYDCAQIMLTLALDMDGKSDPDLVRAMGGLGRGAPGEQPHPKLGEMYASLREWFSEYTAGYGGDSCRCILAGDERNRVMRCPLVVQAVFEKCCGLLEMNGVL